MTELLRLSLLGTPQILIGDRSLTGLATYKKTEALLFYLALTAHTSDAQTTSCSRDAVATLLWGELTDAQAKQNLRNVLSDLRRLVGDHVRIDRQTVAFDRTRPYWLDVAHMQRNLEPDPSSVDLGGRQAAVDLYQGELLHGFYVHNAPLFEAWVVEQREHLHTLVVTALTVLVDEYAQQGNAVAALAANRRLLRLDPWSEPTHRRQMLLLAQTGDRAAALAQYDTCCRMLADEFGIEPLPETTALYEQIRTGKGEREKKANQSSILSSQSSTVRSQSTRPVPERSATESEPLPPDLLRLSVIGHNLPHRTKLFGRQTELARLRKWLMEDGCRLVSIFGIGGQGKTTLAATLVHELAESARSSIQLGRELEAAPASAPAGVRSAGFIRILWQSLLNAPPLAEVLQEWIYVLSDQAVTSLPTSVDQQFAQLLDYLRRQRCLLILDNLESILQSDEPSGHFRPGYESYGQLIRRLAEGEHRSCLLLTSRERPPEVIRLEEETSMARSLSLTGLPAEAGRQMLAGRGLRANLAGLDALVHHYSGNPLALKLAAETVYEIFDGDIAAFLQTEALVFDDVRHVLDQQFARLSPLEGELLRWLAILREPVPFTILRNLLAQTPATRLVLEAVRSLQRRSLLEKFDDGFGLQNVVMEYTTDLLVETISRELFDDKLAGSTLYSFSQSHLNRFALVLAQSKEYVRVSQTRLLLEPVADRLVNQLSSLGAAQQLQRQLVHLRAASPIPGYAAANLLHLLLHLGVDLRGINFAQLYLRQAYLRGVSLPQVNFTGVQMRESVFTEPFGVVYTAAFSPDGQYVAAGTSEGTIYLWRTADQELLHVLQAHQHAIKQLAFAQPTVAEGDHHLVLASASDDKRIGVWSLLEPAQVRWHVQLAHVQQEALIAVGLRSDGQRVIGVDINGHVFVWDVGEHKDTRLVYHFATAFTRLQLVGFSGDGQTVAIGHRDGTVRLWQVATGEARLQLAGMTGLIFSLALSRDGRVLITGGRDGTLCLWDVPDGKLRHVIETKAGAIRVLAFSPDGKFLASCHEDLAIRLWTFDAQGYLQLQRTLVGHTQNIWSVAFDPSLVTQTAMRPGIHRNTPNASGQLLVTSSSDHTIRVWNTETGHLLFMPRGQPRVLAAHTLYQRPLIPLAGQPSTGQDREWWLAAAGYDQLIHLWRGQGHQADGTRHVLRGARGPLYAVAISPDGRSVAGGGYDQIIYLWDRASGQLRQSFHGHTRRVYTLVFHPDGKLLASGSGDGTVRLWTLPEGEWNPECGTDGFIAAHPVAVLEADLDIVHDLAFSPDGRLLARGGSDRLLRLWDMTQPHYPELVEARRLVQDESEEDILGVAFSPDGSKVACSGNHLVHLLDLYTDKAPLSLRHHTAWIYSVAFSPDGTTLASSSADGTVCLWEVTSGTLRTVLRGHRETVYKVVFTLDGSAVVSSSFDGTIKFWDPRSGECVNTLTVEGPYAGMNITGITGVTKAQKAALKVLGAVEE